MTHTQADQPRAATLGLDARFLPADAAPVPLAEGSVDAVFSNRLLHHIKSASERAVFLREFHRVARRVVVVSFFDYLVWGGLRRLLKRLKGRRVNYEGQPSLAEFCAAVAALGFRVERVVPTGPPWVAEKHLVLTKEPAQL